MKIINGTKISDIILKNLANEISHLKLTPQLAIILVGDSAESKVYIRKKQEAGAKIGISVKLYHEETFNHDTLIKLITTLNEDPNTNGIIIQLPIHGASHKLYTNMINTDKDVDGLTSTNLGNLWQNRGFHLISATALAAIHVLSYIADTNHQALKELLTGKKVLIINRSDLIGKPLAALLLAQNATVTIAHSKSIDIDEMIKTSDIVISATGKANLFDQGLLKDDTILIDSGFTRSDGKQHGDIDLSSINNNISWLSPVPNGIGPIGVAKLLENTVKATKHQLSVN